MVGAAEGLRGDGVVGALRFRVLRPQAGSIVLRSALLRTVYGREDSLAVDRVVTLRPAGDFDGSGGLELADFFALADVWARFPRAVPRHMTSTTTAASIWPMPICCWVGWGRRVRGWPPARR